MGSLGGPAVAECWRATDKGNPLAHLSHRPERTVQHLLLSPGQMSTHETGVPPPLVARLCVRSRRGKKVRILFPGGDWIRTCMGLFLSSGSFRFIASSLFGAGSAFFVPSPAIRFPERAEGGKGPKR